MAEKPEKGKCAKCGSENIIFYDDGFGRCLDCGRTFQWKDQEQEPQPQQSKPERSQSAQQQPKRQAPSPTQKSQTSSRTQQPSNKPQQKQSAKKSQTPRQQPTSSRSSSGKSPKSSSQSRSTSRKSNINSKSKKKSKLSKGFLYLTTIGFIVMIVGYILMSVTMMGFDLDPDTVNLLIGMFTMFSYTGVLLIGLGLVYGAVTADSLDKKIRAWMLIAMAILLGLFLSFNMVLSTVTSFGGL